MKENKHLEFKSEVTNTFLKTVSAFANFGDGKILFGVNDDGSICGLNHIEKACLDIENKINDSIAPKPDFELSIDETKNIICLSVYKGSYQPYLYKGKAYRRSDTASIEVDQVELRSLVLEGSHLYFEDLSCGINELNFKELEKKIREKLGVTSLSKDVLRTLGFFTDAGEYNNAAAIFADRNKFYGIDIARFGESISEIMDRETVMGESVLKQYDKAVELFKRYYQYDKISEIERKTVDLIPEAAFREAVANALVHRNWDIPAHVRIAMYSERIEIKSPGGLPSGITKEEYMNGDISCLRNPILGNVFFRLHYIEMFGTGVKRILKLYENAKIKPEFSVTENAISVTLPVLKENYNVTEEEEKVIKMLEDGIQHSSSDISKNTGFNRAKTIRILNRLIDKKYVKAIGNGRGRKYKIV